MSHTPTPWRTYAGRAIVFDADGNYVAYCGQSHFIETEEQKANAEFIVRACNSHDELVAALEDLSGLCERAWDGIVIGKPIRNTAKRVLAKAKGEPTA